MSRRRKIAVVTAGRADYGILRPVLRAIQGMPGLELQLIAAGMHFLPEFGRTADEIRKDGFSIRSRVPLPLSSDDPEAVAVAMGSAVIGYARAFARRRPDILVVSGDRYEVHAAALAALPMKIPVAHIEGGDLTEGAIDDALRHGMTKLSHLHFVSTEAYRRRVIQLGEAPWRVSLTGAPSLDSLRTMPRLDAAELTRRFGIPLDEPPLIATFHPVTLEFERNDDQLEELLAALARFRRPVVFTMPNADTGGKRLSARIRAFARRHPWAHCVVNLGTQAYISLMDLSSGMVGNSSSGLIEAPSVGLPVVNIGDRQRGRVRARNVIDAPCDRRSILKALEKALRPGFRESLKGLMNPYGSGRAASKIASRLASIRIDDRLLIKRFYDLRPSGDINGGKR